MSVSYEAHAPPVRKHILRRRQQSDTTGSAGGLMSGVASKVISLAN